MLPCFIRAIRDRQPPPEQYLMCIYTKINTLSPSVSVKAPGTVTHGLQRAKPLRREQKPHFPVSSPIPGQAVLFQINNLHPGHSEKLLVWGIRSGNFTKKLLFHGKGPCRS